jgi:hypothetical protein
MGSTAGKIPAGQQEGYMNALKQKAQSGQKPGAVRLAGNAPTAPTLPKREDFEAYRQLKETATAARSAATERTKTPQRSGISMGPGTAGRTF